jgi:hypothetical protein
VTTEPSMYKALAMLTDTHAPRVRGREPFWRPPVAPCAKDVHLPAWSWERPYNGGAVRPDNTVSMDVNGAYLAACSSAVFAHGALEHTGADDVRVPGYYLMTRHVWQSMDIVSPLGTGHLTTDRMWVAHPTALLLRQLTAEGYWPDATVHDSYTATDTMRLRRWTDAIQGDRAAALHARAAGVPGAAEQYEAIKDGYSIAVQLMKGPAEGGKVKSKIHRPDWYATVHAQHAASTWRKAWSSVLAGHGPVAMGSVDEVTWTVEDLAEIQFRAKPLFRVDHTGEQIGAFKIKER